MSLSFHRALRSALFALVLIACGDDGDDDDTTPVNDAGAPPAMSGDGGRLTEPGGGNSTMLDPDVVGKTCAADSECTGRGGKCSQRLTLGSVGELAEDAIGLKVFLDNPGGYCSGTCTNDSSCGANGSCFGAIPGLFNGECRKKCTSDGDCRDGYECAKLTNAGGDAGAASPIPLPSTCQPKIKPVQVMANAVGKACTAENAAATCGGGGCTAGSCSALCLADGECGTGARCQPVPFYGTLGVCIETCSADNECNQFAGESGGVGCNMGVCGPKVFPLPPNVVGNACTMRSDCGGSADCATTLGAPARAAPGGYCSLASCASNDQCGGGVCIGVTGVSRCYKGCAANTDCRTGYTCQQRMNIDGDMAGICAPAPATMMDGGTPPVSPGG
jgi:hypothetical protein